MFTFCSLQVKTRQMQEGNPYLGVDCNDVGTNDMREQVGYHVMRAVACSLQAALVCRLVGWQRPALVPPGVGWVNQCARRVRTQAFAHPYRPLSALTPAPPLAAPSLPLPLRPPSLPILCPDPCTHPRRPLMPCPLVPAECV